MRITRSFTFACLATLAFVGCEKKEENAQNTESTTGANAVVLSVNGEAYTQADWDADIDIRETLFIHKVGEKNAGDSKKLAQRREGIRLSTLMAFVNDTLWRQTVGETGKVVRAGAAYAESFTNSQARYVKTFGLPGETFDSLLALCDGPREQDRLTEIIALSSEQDAYCRTYFHDDYVVTSNLVEEVLGKVAKMNEIVAVTNAQIFAMASNIVAQARGGADFAQLADKYSLDEAKNPGGALGECDEADFPLDKDTLWPVLKAMKAGDVTGVMDTEDGICIYRCNKVFDGESSKTGDLALDLSRIVLYRALEYPVLTFDQCKKQLESESRQDVMGKILGEARKNVKIELPQGMDSVPRAFLSQFGKSIQQADASEKKPLMSETNKSATNETQEVSK